MSLFVTNYTIMSMKMYVSGVDRQLVLTVGEPSPRNHAHLPGTVSGL